MSALWVSPTVSHRLGVAIRFVDRFTGVVVSEPQRVRLDGHPDWWPVHVRADGTYRFLISPNRPPPPGPVPVLVDSMAATPTYANLRDLAVDVPPPGAPPVPVTRAHYLTEHPLYPTRALRPPPGETAVRVVVARGGTPLPGHQVRVGLGAAPAVGTPEAITDADGEALIRLPAVTFSAVPGAIVDTVDLHPAIRDPADNPLPVAAPAIPVVAEIGHVLHLAIDVP